MVLNIFSILSIYILQTKSVQKVNLQNQYLYIQAKNHLNFFEDYIKTLDLKDKKKIELEDDIFYIYAKIDKKNINIFVKSKNYSIRLYKTIKI